MIQMKRRTFGLLSAVLASILILCEYQACTPATFNSGQSSGPTLAMSGNGDSYSGKPDYFNSVDTNNPCHRLSSSGRPFPRQQIFLLSGVYSLVRDNCQDISPKALDANLIQVDAKGENLIYQGQSFALQNDLSEYNQVPVVCPTGMSVDLASGNQFSSPLDLTDAVWKTHAEIPARLDGSLEALPKFRIEVTDPNRLEDWRRVSQNPVLRPSTQYVTTFLVQAGNVDHASISFNEAPAGQFVVVVDLLNVQAYIQYQIGAANPVITNVQKYGSAVAVSVAFTTSSGLNGPGGDIGVAPYRPGNNDFYKLGDFVFATAASLNFCR